MGIDAVGSDGQLQRFCIDAEFRPTVNVRRCLGPGRLPRKHDQLEYWVSERSKVYFPRTSASTKKVRLAADHVKLKLSARALEQICDEIVLRKGRLIKRSSEVVASTRS